MNSIGDGLRPSPDLGGTQPPFTPLKLQFSAERYGPYSDQLRHLLDGLDGSYLHSERRLADARPGDPIYFVDARREDVARFLQNPQSVPYSSALARTTKRIDGFESPLGMELLSTIDWLLSRMNCVPTLEGIREGLTRWPGEPRWAARKSEIFTDRWIEIALDVLQSARAQGPRPIA